MMTYTELKEACPLGCEVKLHPIKGEQIGTPPTEGKILAILDPEKHGPKCLLFKIEKPEGRRISRESAFKAVSRKFKAERGIDGKIKLKSKATILCGVAREEVPESVDLIEGIDTDEYGTLKWLRPSDIKERVGLEKGAAEGLRRLAESQKEMDLELQEHINENWLDLVSESNKPKETMDRKEELKRILKPGMKVKLKKDYDGPITSTEHPNLYDNIDKSLGKWVELEHADDNHFSFLMGSSEVLMAYSMIEKVEKGEKGGELWEIFGRKKCHCGRDPKMEIVLHPLNLEYLGGSGWGLEECDKELRPICPEHASEDNINFLLEEVEDAVKELRSEESREEEDQNPDYKDEDFEPSEVYTKVYKNDQDISDTIPVPREKVKEELKSLQEFFDEDKAESVINSYKDLFECKAGNKGFIDTLLQEIEEEEKYVKGMTAHLQRDVDDNSIFTVTNDRLLVMDGIVPEIHEQDGKYVVKFKRNDNAKG